jgi:hypothetical protein
LKIIDNLNETIPFIPYIKKGKYNKNIGTFILIGGSGYTSVYFDKFNVNKNDKFYRKFNYEVEYPNINFQTRLSKISTTFAFDRPTDLLNLNLYSNQNNDNIYVASLKDLTIKKYSQFLYNLFNYHKIKPPYIFIVFSEGGYDVMCFSKYYSKLIKKIYFIDTPFLDEYLLMFEKFRGNIKWYENLRKKQFSWNKNNTKMISNILDKDILDKDILEKIDIYNFEIKTYNIILKLKINDLPKNIPIIILWSQYFDSPTKISKEKVYIIKQMNKEIDKYNNIQYFFINAPHQMERVIPISLSNFITNTLIV